MEKKYTEEDLIEIEKIHRENYKQIHNLTRNIFDITSDKVVRSKLLELMSFVYGKELFCQKDIDISKKDIKISESDTCNNNSL